VPPTARREVLVSVEVAREGIRWAVLSQENRTRVDAVLEDPDRALRA